MSEEALANEMKRGQLDHKKEQMVVEDKKDLGAFMKKWSERNNDIFGKQKNAAAANQFDEIMYQAEMSLRGWTRDEITFIRTLNQKSRESLEFSVSRREIPTGLSDNSILSLCNSIQKHARTMIHQNIRNEISRIDFSLAGAAGWLEIVIE